MFIQYPDEYILSIKDSYRNSAQCSEDNTKITKIYNEIDEEYAAEMTSK